ncbi:allantoate permease [Durotheca rogersii]|uniref:allantoate permease n=1 Tax=Durotheca rogersii TaxID=419775 RepID=UPI00222116BA|nr:allantoate permease [Durotheca rogersii]KAI5856784.1 allantoate permease [Durotheca rogersii]
MSVEKSEKEGQVPEVVDADAALEYLHREGAAAMTEADEKALVRKLDLKIVPLMWACYNLQYLDKTLINYANVMGLQEDTGITGNQFALLATLFYVTYLVFEFPTGYLMQRLPTAKYLGANVFLWGLIVALNSAAKNWAALATLRVLLGCFEASVAPALILVTSMWYKRSEQPLRVGFWYLGTGTGSIIGALSSFGFQHYESDTFTSWQIMFLLFGSITMAVGILTAVFLPDSPMTSRLTREEKIWAIERLRENQTGIENKHFKWYQVRDCFTDPQTWIIAFITVAMSIPNGAISSFQATIIKGFGYTSKETALLSIPSGVLTCVSVIAAGVGAAKYDARGPVIVTLLLVGGILGGGLLAFSHGDAKAALLTGNYLTNTIGAALPMLYSYAAANVAGHTKKVTANAMLLAAFCLGNIIGPLTFRDADRPAYLPAKAAIVASTAAAALATAALIAYYRWENARRDRRYGGLAHRADSEFFDLTDRENTEFRYRW